MFRKTVKRILVVILCAVLLGTLASSFVGKSPGKGDKTALDKYLAQEKLSEWLVWDFKTPLTTDQNDEYMLIPDPGFVVDQSKGKFTVRNDYYSYTGSDGVNTTSDFVLRQREIRNRTFKDFCVTFEFSGLNPLNMDFRVRVHSSSNRIDENLLRIRDGKLYAGDQQLARLSPLRTSEIAYAVDVSAEEYTVFLNGKKLGTFDLPTALPSTVVRFCEIDIYCAPDLANVGRETTLDNITLYY